MDNRLTLSQLQSAIRETLADGFRAPVWVAAEIADLKINHSSGHCYLEFVEKGAANGVPKAQARAVIWRQTYGMLSSYFKGATGQDLRSGMKVLVKVAVTYHELYGLSLQVTDIDPMYTLGDMERQRQETIDRLREDGVFDLNRELPMPDVPQRIAVVSSPGAAGLRDFLVELHAGAYGFATELFEALMQGHGAEEAIIGALERIAGRAGEFDAVVIIRGGGSQGDLNFLNSYLLSCNVAQFPLPVISGLGHDKDRSVLDMVAAVSLKTPTAVASYLVQRAEAVDAALDSLEGRILGAAEHSLTHYGNRLARLAVSLSTATRNVSHRMDMSLAQMENELARRTERLLITQRNRLGALDSLLRERTRNALRSSAAKLDGAAAAVSARDPQLILAMGFAIVRSAGRVLRDASQTVPGDRLDITLAEGRITAKIEDNGKE